MSKHTILFSATFCGPCHVLKNTISREKYIVDEIVDFDDSDRALELYSKYKVKTVPTLIVIDEDETFEILKGSDITDYLKNKG